MRDGLSGAPVDSALRYADAINAAAVASNTSAPLLYAIACNETILGDYGGKWNAATVVSADGGHGLFQLTSYVPPDWADPKANALDAANGWVVPAWKYWAQQGYVGSDLVRCIAASFNRGLNGAIADHQNFGDVDAKTTDHYGGRALVIYQQIVSDTFSPPGVGGHVGLANDSANASRTAQIMGRAKAALGLT